MLECSASGYARCRKSSPSSLVIANGEPLVEGDRGERLEVALVSCGVTTWYDVKEVQASNRATSPLNRHGGRKMFSCDPYLPSVPDLE